MYILYLDESGTHGEASYFVLGGLAVFEREIHWFSQDLDRLQNEYVPSAYPVHFHAAKLRGKSNEAPWDKLGLAKRRELKDKVYEIIRNRKGILFACAIEKEWSERNGVNAYEHAFEQVVSRFDIFLSRVNHPVGEDVGEEQRGLLVLADSSYNKTLAVLARKLQSEGTRWGTQLRNITDVPFFAPSRDTRLLQLADFCSNAVYGNYHSGLSRDFYRIAPKFDHSDGVFHGLVHLTTDYMCVCPACFSRSNR